MATSTNYTGRRVDAWAFSGDYVGQLNPDLLGNEVCAGVIKLAQRWMVGLLTELGSMPYNPTYGTTFITAMREGDLKAESDVASAFLVATDDLKDLMSAEEDAEADAGTPLPDDELYDRCELLAVSITADWKIDLRVRLYSVAGDSRVVLVPVRGDSI